MAGDKKVIVNLGKPWTGKVDIQSGRIEAEYLRRPNTLVMAALVWARTRRGPFYMTRVTEADRKNARFAMSVHCYREADWPINAAVRGLLGANVRAHYVGFHSRYGGSYNRTLDLLEAGLWGAILGRHYKYQLLRADQGFERRGQRNWKPIQTWDERIVARDYREATTPTRLPE